MGQLLSNNKSYLEHNPLFQTISFITQIQDNKWPSKDKALTGVIHKVLHLLLGLNFKWWETNLLWIHTQIKDNYCIKVCLIQTFKASIILQLTVDNRCSKMVHLVKWINSNIWQLPMECHKEEETLIRQTLTLPRHHLRSTLNKIVWAYLQIMC